MSSSDSSDYYNETPLIYNDDDCNNLYEGLITLPHLAVPQNILILLEFGEIRNKYKLNKEHSIQYKDAINQGADGDCGISLIILYNYLINKMDKRIRKWIG